MMHDASNFESKTKPTFYFVFITITLKTEKIGLKNMYSFWAIYLGRMGLRIGEGVFEISESYTTTPN